MNGKPMLQILLRLAKFSELAVLVLGDSVLQKVGGILQPRVSLPASNGAMRLNSLVLYFAGRGS